MDDELPTLTSVIDNSIPVQDWKCWRWIRDDTTGNEHWPQIQAHRNDFIINEQCPATPDGGLKVTRTIKRATFKMFNRDSLLTSLRERAEPSGGAYPDCEVRAKDHQF